MAGTRQRGDVQDRPGLEFRGVAEHVGQGEPSLGVGVVDLDGFPVFRPEDVVGPVGVPAGHVLGCPDQAVDLQREAQGADSPHGRQDGAGPGLVPLHGAHVVPGLDVQAAAVKGQSLADEGDAPLRRAFRLPGEVDEAGLVFRAFPDAPERLHPHGPDGRVVVHGALQSGFIRDLPRTVGQGLGVDDVTGLAGEVPGLVLGSGHDGARFEPFLVGAFKQEGFYPETGRLVLRVAPVLVESVARKDGSLGCRLGKSKSRGFGQDEGHFCRPVPDGRADEFPRRLADGLGSQVLLLSQAHQPDRGLARLGQ